MTMTIVMPSVGVGMFIVFVGLLLYLPYRVTKRRNLRAAEAGKPLTEEIKGAGHGFRAAGNVVHFLARWRVITIPAVVALAIVGAIGAFQVEEAFEIKEFFKPSSAFIQSLDKLEELYEPSSGGGDYIYVEGDLTNPDTLQAMEGAIAAIDASDADLNRNFNGDLEVGRNAIDVVRIVTASAPATNAIQTELGVAITDSNGDGLADSSEQIAAIYNYVKNNGVVNNEGFTVFTPAQLESFLFVDGGTQATRLEVFVPTITDEAIILPARAAIEDAADGLRANTGAGITTLGVTGTAIETQATLTAFTDSMLTSLPIAIALTAILVLLVLRSFRYALVSMVPILLVVAWIYGFMFLVDYKINVITATIAAIAIGVGIDYSTHFTVRFLEEFEGEPSRFPALRRAGEGTGGALAISALTSILGFTVLALSPVPMFRTFGVLTAMMIVFAVSVSLLVLPSLLLLVTPSRKGEEREEMIDLLTAGEHDYEPHARETAFSRGRRCEDRVAGGTSQGGRLWAASLVLLADLVVLGYGPHRFRPGVPGRQNQQRSKDSPSRVSSRRRHRCLRGHHRPRRCRLGLGQRVAARVGTRDRQPRVRADCQPPAGVVVSATIGGLRSPAAKSNVEHRSNDNSESRSGPPHRADCGHPSRPGRYCSTRRARRRESWHVVPGRAPAARPVQTRILRDRTGSPAEKCSHRARLHREP